MTVYLFCFVLILTISFYIFILILIFMIIHFLLPSTIFSTISCSMFSN
uniref:Uncharacterized protein n=1 Tax=Anguilla anguilla TaxID=7936 RepID=A0A0E9TZN0_ANGAN